ncbi:MAG: efflux RND transporter periplasmic adaptor subunit [Proteobacteria bacterium]|nr:efflux RND transporter periplasmic adaptor subunit [Pseudomonadota bacterium]
MAGPSRKKVLFVAVLLAAIIAVAVIASVRLSGRRGLEQARTAKRPPLTVKAVRARLGPIQAWVSGQGTARAVRREFLTFEQSGKVVFVKKGENGRELKEGDRVQGPRGEDAQGELLAKVDERDFLNQARIAEAELAQTRQQGGISRAQLDKALADLKMAEADVERYRKLYERAAVSKRELDFHLNRLKSAETAVEASRAQTGAAGSGVASARARVGQSQVALERTRIYAPFDGILTYVNIREGDYFSPNLVNLNSEESLLRTIPMVIIDPSRYEITLELPYFDAMLLTPGQPAFILAGGLSASGPDEASPGAAWTARGTVFSVNPAVSPGGRSVQVKIRTTQGAENLLDGMFVNCWIVAEEKKAAVVAPLNAFVYRQNRSYVFVVDEPSGQVAQRRVSEGIMGLTSQEISDGVTAGELLVTDGRHRLVDGSPVEVLAIEGQGEK